MHRIEADIVAEDACIEHINTVAARTLGGPLQGGRGEEVRRIQDSLRVATSRGKSQDIPHQRQTHRVWATAVHVPLMRCAGTMTRMQRRCWISSENCRLTPASVPWINLGSAALKGDPGTCRLLFNAAVQAQRSPLWGPYYLGLRQRGLSATAAFVALGRSLACESLFRAIEEWS